MANMANMANIESVKINASTISKEAQKDFKEFSEDLQNKKSDENLQEINDAFTEHADEILEGIKDNMIDNFGKIDMNNISIYEAAKIAFDNDIQNLITINTPGATTAETETQVKNNKKEKASNEKTNKKLAELLDITEEIGYIIGLKKLENNIRPKGLNEDEAGKMLIFVNNNKIPTKPGNPTRKEVITKEIETIATEKKTKQTEQIEKNSLETILSKTPSLDIAKELFETNEAAWNELIRKGDIQVTDEKQKNHLQNLLLEYVKTLYKNATTVSYEIKQYPTTKDYYIQVRVSLDNGSSTNVDIKFGKTSDALYQARADNFEAKRSREDYTRPGVVKFTNESVDFTADKKLTDVGAKKPIHEIIDMTNPPKKIKIKRSNGTTEEAMLEEKYTDANITEAEPTYITQNKKIVQLQAGDTIEGTNTSLINDLEYLDNVGSYREFEDIIEKSEDKSTFLKKALSEGILKTINEANRLEDNDAKKNGYYDVIIDQIIKTNDQSILNAYLGNVVVGDAVNLKYLGTDREHQRINFNKIVTKRPIETGNPNREALNKIRGQIAENTNPKTVQESLEQGFDALVDTFGPLLFSVLKMFGMGKGSLLSMFPGAADKINAMFAKEYSLDENAVLAITTITGKYDDKKIFSSTTPAGRDIKKSFLGTKTDDNIKDYIKNMGENYTYISVAVFKKGLDLYNKDATTKKSISEVIKIKTDPTTKKQEIIGMEDESIFRGVMSSILKSDDIRANIAAANGEIQTAKEDQTGNEFFKNASEGEIYGIKSLRDVVRYVTASLFSDKYLADVLVENGLYGDRETGPDTPDTEKNYIVTTESDFYTDPTKPIEKKTLIAQTSVKSIVENKKEVVPVLGSTIGFTEEPNKSGSFRKVTATIDNKEVVGWILEDNIQEKKVETPPEKTLTFINQKEDFDEKGKLTAAGYKKTINEVVDIPNSPAKLQIIRGTQTINIEQKEINKKMTYVKEGEAKQVQIFTGDKIQAVPENTETVAETVNTKWKAINKNLNDTKKSGDKTEFEKTNYILNDKNAYQGEIKKLGEMFTTATTYNELIGDTDKKATLTDMFTSTNIPHIKNMFKYGKLQKSDKITIDENIITNIDPKYSYEINSATAEKGIVITTKDGATEKGTITIKNSGDKVTTSRAATPEKPSA